MKTKILKNSSYILIAQGFNKALSFFYTVYLARSLDVENFGYFTVALSYFSLLSAIADFGISRYLIREVARGQKSMAVLLANILILRISAVSILFAIFAVTLYLLDPSSDRVSITLIAVLAIIPQSIALTIDGVFIALQKINLSAIGLSILAIVTSLIGFILVFSGFGVMGATAALVFGQIIYAIVLSIILFKQKIRPFAGIETKIIKEIVIGSLPYGLLGVLGLIYFKVDTILLSYMKSSYDTGIYAAAYKFLEAIIFIPSAVSVALFPVLAKLHETDSQALKKLYFKSLRVMLYISLPIMLGYIFLLPFVINFLLPQYQLSIFVIQVLALTIPLMFMHTPATVALLSTDKYLKEVVLISIGTLAFNIIFNILLIPKYGIMAAAFVTVLSEGLSLLIFYLLLKYKVFKS